MPGGSSFTVYATSYQCSYGDGDYTYTGNTHVVDGTVVFDLGCAADSWERLAINADADTNSGNVKVLRDGDKVPAVDAAGEEQRNFSEMLGPDVNETGHLHLNDRQVVFLFELSQPDAEFDDGFNDGGDPDYNDAVVLYEFEDFEWNCVENCTTSGTRDGGDGPDVTDPEAPLDGEGPADNTYVITITNSQVVVESSGSEDD